MTIGVNEDGAICPHCGYLDKEILSEDAFKLERDVRDTYCDVCSKKYYITAEVKVVYISSSKIDEEGEMQ